MRRVGVAIGMALVCAQLWAGEIPVKSGEKIAFLGDSITAQGVAPLGYVTLTAAGLKSAGVDIQVIGAGIGGHKSNDMLARLDRDVLSKKPDWITLSCGVNDVWHGANGVPLDQYKTNITAIVDRAQAANIKVMILTATVIAEDLNNPNNQKLAAYNDFLRTLAGEKHCLLADLNADFQKALKAAAKHNGNLLTVDGVHMNFEGNQVMALGVLKAFGLSDEQLNKAKDFWLDIPNAIGIRPVLQGGMAVSVREHRRLETVAARHKMTVDQLATVLYGADLTGGAEAKTAAQIDEFLDRPNRQNAPDVLQAHLNERIKALETETVKQ